MKYVVFKIEDVRRIEDSVGLMALALPDAVVIRRQDLFAGPALHGYASSISVAVSLLRATGSYAVAEVLEEVSDYFHEQAVLADEEGYKIPD